MASRARQGRGSSTESRVQAAGRLREPRTGHILAPRTTALQLRLHVVEVHAGAMTMSTVRIRLLSVLRASQCVQWY